MLPELLGDGGEGGVGLVQARQRHVHALGRLVPRGLQPAGLEGCPLPGRDRLGQRGLGLLDRRLDLQQALLLAGAAGGVPRAEHVAGRGDGGERRLGLDEGPGGREVRDQRDTVQEGGEARAQLTGAVDDVDGPGRPLRQGRPLPRAGRGRAVGQQQGGPTEVVALEVAQRRERGGDVAHGDRIGGRAQCSGHRGLVPVLDGEQGDHRAEDPVDLVGGGEQCPGPVLAGQAQLQRVLAGGEAVPLPVGLLGPITDLGQALLDLVEGGGGLLVLGVETFLPGVEPGDLRLQGREGQLRLLGTGEGFFARLAQPLDLLVGAGRARLQRVDLTVQAGQALAAVGRGPLEAGDAALLLGRRVLGRLAGGDRGVEGGAVGVHLGGDLLLLLGDPVGLGLQRLGVATAGGLDDVAPGGVADALGGQRLGAAQALAQAGEGVPGVLGRRQRRQVLAQRRLQRGLALPGRGDGRLDLLAAGEEDRLVGHLLLQRGAGGDQVVGQQAGPGVAHVGLDRRGAPGHLGLPAQRLELAADLGEQVVETRQVALARVELAQRLLLALAVLEDARGLLDEATAVLRRRVQDRVELALADDDVHLAADAGVREQLLHVQ